MAYNFILMCNIGAARAYDASAEVARMVISSWRSTCALRDPPFGSPQVTTTSVPCSS